MDPAGGIEGMRGNPATEGEPMFKRKRKERKGARGGPQTRATAGTGADPGAADPGGAADAAAPLPGWIAALLAVAATGDPALAGQARARLLEARGLPQGRRNWTGARLAVALRCLGASEEEIRRAVIRFGATGAPALSAREVAAILRAAARARARHLRVSTWWALRENLGLSLPYPWGGEMVKKKTEARPREERKNDYRTGTRLLATCWPFWRARAARGVGRGEN